MKILRFLLASVASSRPIVLAVLSLVIGFALPALAQVPNTLIHSISPPPGVQGYSQLGYSVAVDGGRTVVGAPYDNTVGANSGVAKVFDSVTGALLHVLPNPAPTEATLFGISVGISGKWVVVGAGGKVSSNTFVRSVYVYDLSSGTPTVPVFTLDQPSPIVADNFGRSVAVSDGWVVVGAPLTDVGLDTFGTAYLYNLNSPTPTGLVAVFKSPSLVKDDRFAWSVAISGTRVAIGAYLDDNGATDAGRVYVYDLGNNTPTLPVLTINNPTPAAQDWFGYSLAISGTRVTIGAFLDDTGVTNAGSAYVYDTSSPTPTVPVFTLNTPPNRK